MRSDDRRRAYAVLKEAMYLLRRAKDLPGDKKRRRTMEQVVRWLGEAGR